MEQWRVSRTRLNLITLIHAGDRSEQHDRSLDSAAGSPSGHASSVGVAVRGLARFGKAHAADL